MGNGRAPSKARPFFSKLRLVLSLQGAQMALTATDRLILISVKIQRAKKHLADLEAEVSGMYGFYYVPEIKSRRFPNMRRYSPSTLSDWLGM
jgi:hypothetical protein